MQIELKTELSKGNEDEREKKIVLMIFFCKFYFIMRFFRIRKLLKYCIDVRLQVLLAVAVATLGFLF